MPRHNEHNATRRGFPVGELHPGNTETERSAVELRKPTGNVIPNEQPISGATSVRTSNRLSQTAIPEHIEHLIRRRAYELYERRGRMDGHAGEDWRRAEAEILGTVFRRATPG
jgi:Protein of unknown function (DUF2934)